MSFTCRLIDGATPGKQSLVLAAVALLGRDESDGTMAMFRVAPAHEPSHPDPGMAQAPEGLSGILWPILQCTEQGLEVRIVVADGRAAERGRYTELAQRGQHGGAFHGAAVIAVQYDLAPILWILMKCWLCWST